MKAISLEFDSSQFPGKQEKELKQALLKRSFEAKWHYESYKQVAAWLRVHETYSPARTSSDVHAIYQKAFRALAKESHSIHELISLGCGGAQKDLLCLKALAKVKKTSHYTAVDVGSAMVLSALLRVKHHFPNLKTHGVVTDLLTCGSFEKWRGKHSFFLALGLIPNMEPYSFLKLLRKAAGGKFCLISVNLIPDSNLYKGLKKILPQYNNVLTKQWLSLFPKDLGFDIKPNEIEVTLQPCPYYPDLWRIEANYKIKKKIKISLAGEPFSFGRGENLQLFYSYRYTSHYIESWLKSEKIEVVRSFLASSGEEGLFWLKLS